MRTLPSDFLVRLVLGLVLAGGFISTLSRPAAAQEQSERVAAVVNEDAISMRDFEMRIKLVLLSSSLPDTMETRSRVGGQVLRKLIDERLQLQEADKNKISVSTADINNGISNIEHQNNMPKGAMESLLKNKGIDPETLRIQVKSEIAWARTVRRGL